MKININYLPTSINVSDKCSGASSEWAKGVLGTRYSYTVELPDTGTYGFILPASRIDRTAKGMWAGLTTLLRNI